jgi:lysophospholipase L1-like esterase
MRRSLGALLAATALVVSATACDYTGNPAGVRVSVIGESVARGADAELHADLGQERQVHTLLINSRYIRQFFEFVPEIVADPDLRVLVVQLGVNDTADKRTEAQMRADVRTLLQLAAPRVECIWWLDIKEEVLTNNSYYEAHAPGFNQLLRAEVARYPNAHVADFDAWASARPQYIFKDGLHLDTDGRAPFARWVETDLVDAC